MNNLQVGGTREQPCSRQTLPQDDSQREQVRARIERQVGDLLRRKIAELALHDTDARQPLSALDSHDPEVRQLDAPIEREHHILWTNVAVHERHGLPV